MKHPKYMTRTELEETFSKLISIAGQHALKEFVEQWDLSEGILDEFNFRSTAKDIKVQRWKSTRTKFIKMYLERVRELRKDNRIDHTLLGVLAELATYIHFEDNVLRDDSGKPMTQKELSKALNIELRTLQRYFKKLQDEKILHKKKNPDDKKSNMYYLSAHLFYMGTYIKQDLKEAENELLKKEKERLKEEKKNKQ